MSETPVYTSPCSARSFWQEYRIYDDRVELGTLVGPWVVPFDQVEGVEVAEPLLKALLHLRADMKGWPRQIKLDWADLQEHVALEKSAGLIRKVFFTPADPAAFKNALEEALARYRQRRGTGVGE
jgi:hypothetical protein